MSELLTQEEKNILTIFGKGKTGKQISAQLGISERQVREIKKSFIAKLNARNHTHALCLAIRQGQIVL